MIRINYVIEDGLPTIFKMIRQSSFNLIKENIISSPVWSGQWRLEITHTHRILRLKTVKSHIEARYQTIKKHQKQCAITSRLASLTDKKSYFLYSQQHQLTAKF